MTDANAPLRVALLAGTLARGGAEKQFVYAARALQAGGAEVRVFALTRGEFHEADLTAVGLAPRWIGRHSNPLLRTARFAGLLREWHPHVVQAGHFYVNLHVAMAAGASGALSLGALRSDGERDVSQTGLFGKASLRAPTGLIANSHAARSNAIRLGRSATRVLVVPNVLDIAAFDRAWGGPSARRRAGDGFVATLIARLLPEKRVERFLRGLADARRRNARIRGRIVGAGPEGGALERLAAETGLIPHGVEFLGDRDDVPILLADSDALVLTSDREGFPNVLLEAMAAGLPVVTTPAGDAARVVTHGETGFVVSMDDGPGLADRLVSLADDVGLAQRLGTRGRARLQSCFSEGALGPALREAYAAAARWGPRRTRKALECQLPVS